MKETKENAKSSGIKTVKRKPAIKKLESSSKEEQIAEAFFNSTSFVRFHQKMREIHGTEYRMLTAEHQECVKAIKRSEIRNPESLVKAYELLLQKKLQQPFEVRYFIKRLFNIEN